MGNSHIGMYRVPRDEEAEPPRVRRPGRAASCRGSSTSVNCDEIMRRLNRNSVSMQETCVRPRCTCCNSTTCRHGNPCLGQSRSDPHQNCGRPNCIDIGRMFQPDANLNTVLRPCFAVENFPIRPPCLDRGWLTFTPEQMKNPCIKQLLDAQGGNGNFELPGSCWPGAGTQSPDCSAPGIPGNPLGQPNNNYSANPGGNQTPTNLGPNQPQNSKPDGSVPGQTIPTSGNLGNPQYPSGNNQGRNPADTENSSLRQPVQEVVSPSPNNLSNQGQGPVQPAKANPPDNLPGKGIPGSAGPGDDAPGNVGPGGPITGNTYPGNAAPGSTNTGNGSPNSTRPVIPATGNAYPDNAVPGTPKTEGNSPGNLYPGNGGPNAIPANAYPDNSSGGNGGQNPGPGNNYPVNAYPGNGGLNSDPESSYPGKGGMNTAPGDADSDNGGLNAGPGNAGLNTSPGNSGLNAVPGNGSLNSGPGNTYPGRGGHNAGPGNTYSDNSGINSGPGNGELNSGPGKTRPGNSGLNAGPGNGGLNAGPGKANPENSGRNAGPGNGGLNAGHGKTNPVNSGLNAGPGNGGLSAGPGNTYPDNSGLNAGPSNGELKSGPGNTYPGNTGLTASPGNGGLSSGPGKTNPDNTGLNTDPGNTYPGNTGLNTGPGNTYPGNTGLNTGPVNTYPGNTGLNTGPGNTYPGNTGLNTGPGNTYPGNTGLNTGPGNTYPGNTGLNTGPGNAYPGNTGLNTGPGHTYSGNTGLNTGPGNTYPGNFGLNTGPGNTYPGNAGSGSGNGGLNADPGNTYPGNAGLNTGPGNVGLNAGPGNNYPGNSSAGKGYSGNAVPGNISPGVNNPIIGNPVNVYPGNGSSTHIGPGKSATIPGNSNPESSPNPSGEGQRRSPSADVNPSRGQPKKGRVSQTPKNPLDQNQAPTSPGKFSPALGRSIGVTAFPGNGAPGNSISGNNIPLNSNPESGMSPPGNKQYQNPTDRENPSLSQPFQERDSNPSQGPIQPGQSYPADGAPGNPVAGGAASGNPTSAFGNGTPGNGVPGRGSSGYIPTGSDGNGSGFSGNAAPGNTIPGNNAPGNSVPRNAVSGNPSAMVSTIAPPDGSQGPYPAETENPSLSQPVSGPVSPTPNNPSNQKQVPANPGKFSPAFGRSFSGRANPGNLAPESGTPEGSSGNDIPGKGSTGSSTPGNAESRNSKPESSQAPPGVKQGWRPGDDGQPDQGGKQTIPNNDSRPTVPPLKRKRQVSPENSIPGNDSPGFSLRPRDSKQGFRPSAGKTNPSNQPTRAGKLPPKQEQKNPGNLNPTASVPVASHHGNGPPKSSSPGNPNDGLNGYKEPSIHGIRHAPPAMLKDIPGSLKDSPGSLNDTPGSLNGTPGSLNDAPGSLNGTPGSLNDTPGSVKESPGSLKGSAGSNSPNPNKARKPKGGKSPYDLPNYYYTPAYSCLNPYDTLPKSIGAYRVGGNNPKTCKPKKNTHAPRCKSDHQAQSCVDKPQPRKHVSDGCEVRLLENKSTRPYYLGPSNKLQPLKLNQAAINVRPRRPGTYQSNTPVESKYNKPSVFVPVKRCVSEAPPALRKSVSNRQPMPIWSSTAKKPEAPNCGPANTRSKKCCEPCVNPVRARLSQSAGNTSRASTGTCKPLPPSTQGKQVRAMPSRNNNCVNGNPPIKPILKKGPPSCSGNRVRKCISFRSDFCPPHKVPHPRAKGGKGVRLIRVTKNNFPICPVRPDDDMDLDDYEPCAYTQENTPYFPGFTIPIPARNPGGFFLLKSEFDRFLERFACMIRSEHDAELKKQSDRPSIVSPGGVSAGKESQSACPPQPCSQPPSEVCSSGTSSTPASSTGTPCSTASDPCGSYRVYSLDQLGLPSFKSGVKKLSKETLAATERILNDKLLKIGMFILPRTGPGSPFGVSPTTCRSDSSTVVDDQNNDLDFPESNDERELSALLDQVLRTNRIESGGIPELSLQDLAQYGFTEETLSPETENISISSFFENSIESYLGQNCLAEAGTGTPNPDPTEDMELSAEEFAIVSDQIQLNYSAFEDIDPSKAGEEEVADETCLEENQGETEESQIEEEDTCPEESEVVESQSEVYSDDPPKFKVKFNEESPQLVSVLKKPEDPAGGPRTREKNRVRFSALPSGTTSPTDSSASDLDGLDLTSLLPLALRGLPPCDEPVLACKSKSVMRLSNNNESSQEYYASLFRNPSRYDTFSTPLGTEQSAPLAPRPSSSDSTLDLTEREEVLLETTSNPSLDSILDSRKKQAGVDESIEKLVREMMLRDPEPDP